MTLPQYGQPIVQGAGGGSSGPAWLASLPSTLPGDATEYLDGTGQFSTPPPATFGPFTFDVTFDDAAIKANHTTPLELVAAPSAGSRIVPIALTALVDATAGAYVAGNRLQLKYSGGTNFGNLLETDIFTNASINATDAGVMFLAGNPSPLIPVAGDAEALVLTSAADYTGGDAANSLRVIGQYYVFPTA